MKHDSARVLARGAMGSSLMFANGSRNYAKTDNPGPPQQQVAKAPERTAAGGRSFTGDITVTF